MIRPPSPAAHLWDNDGLLLRRDAVVSGIDDNALARLVRGGVLVRIRHGAYCSRDVWREADARERHRLLCRAVMGLYADHVALSHASSCIAQGGPAWGLDLANVHLTHLAGGGRRQSRVVHHAGSCLVGDLRRQDGHWLTVPARAAFETACTDGVEAALVQADHFLHAGLTTPDEIAAAYEAQTRWPGSLLHHPVALLADGRIESVGETRAHYAFWQQGLPRPTPQYEIFRPNGTLAARVDFAWPEHRVVVEFDGVEKYHRYRRPGESIEQMVVREKNREDLVRELTGWTVIRITWSDLSRPIELARRIRRAFALALTA
jgi:very-short-patch-repair endonuclease